MTWHRGNEWYDKIIGESMEAIAGWYNGNEIITLRWNMSI